ncbi:MAG: hypothetical protein WD875_10145 [Pirellulales bacterium]
MPQECEKTVWQFVLQWGVAGFAWLFGVVTPFLLQWFKVQTLGPKLQIREYHEETETNMNGTLHFYANVEVTNVKRRIARSCRGFLLKVESLDANNTPRRVLLERTLQCIWEFDAGRDSFDIPNGAKPCFNVIRRSSTENTDRFELGVRKSTGEQLNPIPFNHLLAGEMRLRLSGIVTADELLPKPFSIIVAWTGAWPPIFNPEPEALTREPNNQAG